MPRHQGCTACQKRISDRERRRLTAFKSGNRVVDEGLRSSVRPQSTSQPFLGNFHDPFPHAAPALLTGDVEGSVDAHGIQPFYAGLLARTCGLAVTIAPEGEGVVITAA